MELKKQKFPIWKIPIQNDRVYRYAPLGSQKRQVSAKRLLRTRSTFSKSVMVSVAVSLLGTTELMFIELGAKINGAYYRMTSCSVSTFMAAIHSVAGDYFTYNDPAHRASDTVEVFVSQCTRFHLTVAVAAQ